jgi:type VI secretion system protein ImpK
MTEAFSDLVIPIFREVIKLRNSLSPGVQQSLEDVRTQIRGWIDDAEKRSRNDDGLALEFAQAKYGVVAWVDEILTDSSWGDSVGWGSRKNILEWDLYGSQDRAWKFIEMAEESFKAVSEARSSSDPLESYLLCIALGFLGDLRFDQTDYHSRIDRYYSKITETSPMASKPFGDDPPDSLTRGLEPRQGPELLLRVSTLTAITALVTLIGYLIAVHFQYTPQS